MSRASRAERKAEKKAQKMVTINDQYDESSRVLTDEEAHRNVSYELPSFASQTYQCFIVQMKRYTRQRIMWMCIVLLALIVIIYVAIKSFTDPGMMLPNTDVANTYIAALMSMSAIIIPLLSAIAFGSMLSHEFNERTVFLSLPLPMSRASFYLGKFLAGFVLIEGTVAAAYGISAVIALGETSRMYSMELFVSFIVASVYTLFCCSFAYALSTKSKRGSSMLPFILLYIILPLVSILVMAYVHVDILYTIFSYMPCFAGELSLNVLSNTTAISVGWIMKSMFATSFAITFGSNVIVMTLVCLVTSVLLMYLGYRVVKRRDV